MCGHLPGTACSFCAFCWSTGEAAKGTLNSLLSCMKYVCENAKAVTAMAAKALAGWSVHVPGKPWAPAPKPVVYLCAAALLESGDGAKADAALALVLGFHLYARGGELDHVRCDDFSEADGLRNLYDVPTVALLDTKTSRAGIPELVKIDDPCMADIFRFAVQRARQREPDVRNPYLFSFEKGNLLDAFKKPKWKWGSHDHSGCATVSDMAAQRRISYAECESCRKSRFDYDTRTKRPRKAIFKTLPGWPL